MTEEELSHTDPHVVFIGAGKIGRALRGVVNDRFSNIAMWDRKSEKVPDMRPLEELVPEADIIFLCVPSWAIYEVSVRIADLLPESVTVVTPAKGIDDDEHKLMHEVLEKYSPDSASVALLYGPMLADEVQSGIPSVGILGTEDRDAFLKISALFSGTNIGFTYTKDIRGVAIAGVLKNIYAISFGMIAELGWGKNTMGAFTVTALHEMTSIIELLGGTHETAYGMAGLGDLIATGSGALSKNFRLGAEIVETGGYEKGSEGSASLAALIHMLQDQNTSLFPLLETIARIVIEGNNAKETLEEYMYSGRSFPKTLSSLS